jgi:hypothetical protein
MTLVGFELTTTVLEWRKTVRASKLSAAVIGEAKTE